MCMICTKSELTMVNSIYHVDCPLITELPNHIEQLSLKSLNIKNLPKLPNNLKKYYNGMCVCVLLDTFSKIYVEILK